MFERKICFSLKIYGKLAGLESPANFPYIFESPANFPYIFKLKKLGWVEYHGWLELI